MANRNNKIVIDGKTYTVEDDIFLREDSSVPAPKKTKHKSLTAMLAALTVGLGAHAMSTSAEESEELPDPAPAKEVLFTPGTTTQQDNLYEAPTTNSFEEINEVIQETDYAKIFARLKDILPNQYSDDDCKLYSEVLERLTTTNKGCTAPKLSDDSMFYYVQMAAKIPTNQLQKYLHKEATYFSFDRLQSALRLTPTNTEAIAQQTFLQTSRYQALDRANTFLPTINHEGLTDYIYCDAHLHPTLDCGINVDGINLELLDKVRFNVNKTTYAILFPDDSTFKNFPTNAIFLASAQLDRLKENAKSCGLGNRTPAKRYEGKYGLTVCDEDKSTLEDYRKGMIAEKIRLAETGLDRAKPASMKESGLFGTYERPLPNGAVDNMIDFKWQRPGDTTVYSNYLERNWKKLDAMRAQKGQKSGGFLFDQHPERNQWKSDELQQAIADTKIAYNREVTILLIQHEQKYLESLGTDDAITPKQFIQDLFKDAHALAQVSFYRHTIFPKDRLTIFNTHLPHIVQTLWPNASEKEIKQHKQNLTTLWTTLDSPKSKTSTTSKTSR